MIEDVELLLSSHGIKYQKKGSKILCLCPNPEHDDRHIGSFSFDTIKGVGNCFACHYSCNIFSLNKLLFFNRGSIQSSMYYKNISFIFIFNFKFLYTTISAIKIIETKTERRNHLSETNYLWKII